MQFKPFVSAALILFAGLATPVRVSAVPAHAPQTQAGQPSHALSELALSLSKLAKAPLPANIELNYSWGGYALTHSETRVSLRLNQQQYQASGKHQILSYNNAPPKTSLIKQTLPASLITRILSTLGPATWQGTDQPQTRQDHTDDYPSHSLTLYPGTPQEIQLFSRSNTPYRTPWNLRIGQKLYASSDENIGKAVLALFEPLK